MSVFDVLSFLLDCKVLESKNYPVPAYILHVVFSKTIIHSKYVLKE